MPALLCSSLMKLLVHQLIEAGKRNTGLSVIEVLSVRLLVKGTQHSRTPKRPPLQGVEIKALRTTAEVSTWKLTVSC